MSAVASPLTDEQAGIVRTVHGRPQHSLKISAYAGTGKTTTLFAVAQAADRPGLYLAFNKRNADEAQRKFPDHIECRTTHSLAYRGTRAGQVYREKLNTRMTSWKVADLLAIEPFGDIHRTHIGYSVKEAINRFCQSSDRQIEARHCFDRERNLHYFIRRLREETQIKEEDRLEALARFRLSQYQDYILSRARELWEAMIDPDHPCGITHDTYLKVWQLSGPRLSQYQFIMLDEAQDTNDCVLDIFSRQRAQQVMVGDSHQAIYGWRGACNAMEKAPADHELHLTQSFRFGQAVANVANSILRLKPGAKELPRLKGNPARQSTIGNVEGRFAVVCRTNGMVFNEALRAIQEHKSISVIGGLREPIELIRSVYGLMQDDPSLVTHPDIKLFDAWEDFRDEALHSLNYARLVRFVEKHGADCLDMCDEIEQAGEVPPDRADVVLTTAHKSKGLEWPQVKMGNDFAGDSQDSPATPYGLPNEEINLLYVAATRALDRLQPNRLVRLMLLEFRHDAS